MSHDFWEWDRTVLMTKVLKASFSQTRSQQSLINMILETIHNMTLMLHEKTLKIMYWCMHNGLLFLYFNTRNIPAILVHIVLLLSCHYTVMFSMFYLYDHLYEYTYRYKLVSLVCSIRWYWCRMCCISSKYQNIRW